MLPARAHPADAVQQHWILLSLQAAPAVNSATAHPHDRLARAAECVQTVQGTYQACYADHQLPQQVTAATHHRQPLGLCSLLQGTVPCSAPSPLATTPPLEPPPLKLPQLPLQLPLLPTGLLLLPLLLQNGLLLPQLLCWPGMPPALLLVPPCLRPVLGRV